MTTMATVPKGVNKTDLEKKVKKMYTDVALHPEATYHFEIGRALAERLGYPTQSLDLLPPPSIDSFAGVGYFFDMADLSAGEKVLDLGSGSGMDAFYAAGLVGNKGEVIGLDITIKQIEKATKLRDQFDFSQVVFQKSHIETLPVISNSIDVVISNGVINLSSEKEKVFQEAARVLKPGGRLALADIVTDIQLPESITCNATLWAACIGGAMQKDEYIRLIENAGLKLVKQRQNPYSFLSNNAKGATKDYGIKSISLLAINNKHLMIL